jgi:hypothetical protein
MGLIILQDSNTEPRQLNEADKFHNLIDNLDNLIYFNNVYIID